MGHLTVRTMAKLSGVSAHTLRAWEKRYGALKPARTEGRQRSYSVLDLERLRKLKQLVDDGWSIGRIANLPNEELDKLILEKTSSSEAPFHRTSGFHHEHREFIARIVNDLADFKLDEVYRGLTALRVRLGARDFVLGVAAPILKEIGHLVAAGTMTISQEHAFSALLRDQLGHLIQSGRVTTSEDTFVTATSEGDLHEFGILLAQILCLSRGIKCHNLGPNIPAESLVFAARALGVNHVAIGFADVPESLLKVSAIEYVKAVRQGLPKSVTILVGGAGIKPEYRETLREYCVLVPTLNDLDQMLLGVKSQI